MRRFRLARHFTVLLIAGAALAGTAPRLRADELTEANMTQKDMNEITQTESSVPGQPPITVNPIHNLSDADAKAVKDNHGVKVIKAKDWKKMSAAERDKTLRGYENLMKGYYYVEVPSGNVWRIGVVDHINLAHDKVVRAWTKEEIEKLPKAVKRDPVNKQEDRRNDTPLRERISLDRDP